MSRVLIVEDEEAIADLEKDYLELSGFTVEIENNGTAGLKRALSEEFDMFILDLMLPGTDGFEICKKIREENSLQQKNLIFLPYWQKIQTMCLQRKNCSGKSGIWNPSEILQQLPCISRRSAKRSR